MTFGDKIAEIPTRDDFHINILDLPTEMFSVVTSSISPLLTLLNPVLYRSNLLSCYIFIDDLYRLVTTGESLGLTMNILKYAVFTFTHSHKLVIFPTV